MNFTEDPNAESTLLGCCEAMSFPTSATVDIWGHRRGCVELAAREQLLETVDLLKTTHPGLASVMLTHHLEELPRTVTPHQVCISSPPRDRRERKS